MTFVEFLKELDKECKCGQSKEQIRDTVYSAFRVIIEELCADPENSEFYVPNWFRLHLIKDSHSVTVNLPTFPHYGEKVTYHYFRFKFEPSMLLKDVVNGRKPLSQMTLGMRPLYPNLKKRKKYTYKNPRPKRERPDWLLRNIANRPKEPVTITEQDFINSDIGKLSLEAERTYKQYLIEKRRKIQEEARAMVEKEKRKEKMEVDMRLPEDEA